MSTASLHSFEMQSVPPPSLWEQHFSPNCIGLLLSLHWICKLSSLLKSSQPRFQSSHHVKLRESKRAHFPQCSPNENMVGNNKLDYASRGWSCSHQNSWHYVGWNPPLPLRVSVLSSPGRHGDGKWMGCLSRCSRMYHKIKLIPIGCFVWCQMLHF